MDRFRQDYKTDDSSVVKDVMNEEWMRLSEENTELPPWRPTRESCTPFTGVSINRIHLSVSGVLTLSESLS